MATRLGLGKGIDAILPASQLKSGETKETTRVSADVNKDEKKETASKDEDTKKTGTLKKETKSATKTSSKETSKTQNKSVTKGTDKSKTTKTSKDIVKKTDKVVGSTVNAKKAERLVDIKQTPESNISKTETAKIEASKKEATKTGATKTGATKTEATKTEATKTEATKTEATKTETKKTEATKTEATKNEATKTEAAKAETLAAEAFAENSVVMMKLANVEPNRSQPRKEFKDEALAELAESIKNHGIIQPLIVRQKGSAFEIVAGERRWRAARLAGLKEVPVVIKDYSDGEIAEVALVENLQREDLNPIEEALAYQCLIDEFDLKQDEIAFRVSKSRTVIANSLRLLKLHPEVQKMLSDGIISTGHGKVLLSLDTQEQQLMVANQIVAENLSVRMTEERVKLVLNPPAPKTKKVFEDTAIYRDLENRIRAHVNTKVKIQRTTEKKGKIEISYDSIGDLERILDAIGVKY